MEIFQLKNVKAGVMEKELQNHTFYYTIQLKSTAIKNQIPNTHPGEISLSYEMKLFIFGLIGINIT